MIVRLLQGSFVISVISENFLDFDDTIQICQSDNDEIFIKIISSVGLWYEVMNISNFSMM